MFSFYKSKQLLRKKQKKGNLLSKKHESLLKKLLKMEVLILQSEIKEQITTLFRIDGFMGNETVKHNQNLLFLVVQSRKNHI